MVIQACQQPLTHGVVPATAVTTAADPAIPSQVTGARHDNKHIVLTRPHTVLMLSTMLGGEAIRGAFTGALGAEICLADGVKDINSMFNNAVHRMQRDDPLCVNQWPEIRHITSKNLILPPVYSDTATAHM